MRLLQHEFQLLESYGFLRLGFFLNFQGWFVSSLVKNSHRGSEEKKTYVKCLQLNEETGKMIGWEDGGQTKNDQKSPLDFSA